MAFVGRTRPLSRVLATVADASRGRARLVLVSGPAGIGKTTLVGEAVLRAGLPVGWGTCADAERTPAMWPWTTALRGLSSAFESAAAALTAADTVELARVLPELAPAGPGPRPDDRPDTDAARLRLFDAVARFVEGLARQGPALLVLDDLQWADASSLALLRFLARPYRPIPLVIIGAYRDDELDATAAAVLDELAAHSELVALRGLSRDEVFELVTDTVDGAGAQRWADEVHRRTGGHPFLAQQLTELLADPAGSAGEVPAAVREVVAHRTARLSAGAVAMVETAAVAGTDLVPDVLGAVCGVDQATVAALCEEGVAAGVLARDHMPARTRIAHDLFRESIVAGISVERRLHLHGRIADALEHRHERGAAVLAADLARHCAAAVPVEGGVRAVRWAHAAADVERRRLAFGEAAGHLARARRAVEDAGVGAGPALVDLLVEEADAQARAGDPTRARALLDDAWQRATALGDGERLGRVALGVQRLGARFAMPRDAVVAVLEGALAASRGTGTALEAQLLAGLARELHHSVPEQRPRAGPLSEKAIDLARGIDDPETLHSCLLARHDVLWTPGRAAQRVGIAREITQLAERAGDAERHADGLLLTANALLEEGSAAFRSALAQYLHAAEQLRQPHHDYLVATRRGALALIDGRLDDAENLIGDANALGERIAEPDAGNVRMSQQLGLVRARGDPERLRATAAEAVRWWVGVPSHAHAVAAGFLALAGDEADLEAARRALDTVLALDTWRADRSYLWSVFVGSMTTAAIGLRDHEVCTQLLAELGPVTGSCGVNGALVCFMGSNAHWAGVLSGALGRRADAERSLLQALAVHRRLGARPWEAETCLELARLTASPEHAERATALAAEHGLHGVAARLAPSVGRVTPHRSGVAELRRDGELWRIRYRDSTAHLPDIKGLADLAVLLARPGAGVHVIELAGATTGDHNDGDLLDPRARAAYRHRLAEIDRELQLTRDDHDLGRVQELELQHTALLSELRRAAGLAGRPRALGSSTTERARKAVTARIRDAIRRIGLVHPELGGHLDRSVRTGTRCCYQPTEAVTWTLAPHRN
ncbi:ATP-binding protein [Pseudonocardia xinjiangensis]|uniref:ATP-binding protein n=1 Tax=Pseudonocardia xinjiangensis TaxID=75289 RepID=UPI003D91404C